MPAKVTAQPTKMHPWERAPQLVSGLGPTPATALQVTPSGPRNPLLSGGGRPVALEYPLPVSLRVFEIGSGPRAEIAILDAAVSARHSVITRVDELNIEVADLGSTNGTWYKGHRRRKFYPDPGDTFVVGNTVLMLMNDTMRAALATFDLILGPDTEESPYDLLATSVADSTAPGTPVRHILFLGRPDNEQHMLADAMHTAGLRGLRQSVLLDFSLLANEDGQRRVLEAASKSTLIVKIPAKMKKVVKAPLFWSKVFDPSSLVRVIAIASRRTYAERALGEDSVARLHPVNISALNQRSDQHQLFDKFWKRWGEPLRWNCLTVKNQRALREHWPKNLTSLRRSARILAGIANARSWPHHDDWPRRAALLKVPESSLRDWYYKSGISEPLVEPAADFFRSR